MKTTYTSTRFITDLTKATIAIHMYNKVKYKMSSEQTNSVAYIGVKSYDIIKGGIEAKEIESMIDCNSIDDFHTYLVLHFENGEVATFRNSYVDMFII